MFQDAHLFQTFLPELLVTRASVGLHMHIGTLLLGGRVLKHFHCRLCEYR